MTIREFLSVWTARFRESDIPSARLDAEIILLFSLQNFAKNGDDFSRSFLFAHDDFVLPKRVLKRAKKFAKIREKRVPIAQIFREKEFYRRTFFVNKNVLIPRPETEEIIELSRNFLNENFNNFARKPNAIFAKNDPKNLHENDEKSVQKSDAKALEIGAGSSIISVTLALEFPDKIREIFAVDISRKALKVSRKNARKFDLNFAKNPGKSARHFGQNFAKIERKNSRKSDVKIRFAKSDLLKKVDEKYDLIVANLPYVARIWQTEKTSPELKKEPEIALFASDNGNALNKKLVQQISRKNTLADGGILILEMDPEQRDEISTFAKKYGFREIVRKPYHLVFAKK